MAPHLGLCRLDRSPQGSQLTPHLGSRARSGRRCRRPIEQCDGGVSLEFECCLIIGQFGLFRFEAFCGGDGLEEFLTQTSSIRFEVGDDSRVHLVPAIALMGPTAFDEKHRDAAGTFTQLFDLDEFITQAAVAACGQFCFGGQDSRVEIGERLAKLVLTSLETDPVPVQILEP